MGARCVWEVRASCSWGRRVARVASRVAFATGRRYRDGCSRSQRLWFLPRLTHAINEKGRNCWCFFSTHSLILSRARNTPRQSAAANVQDRRTLSHLLFPFLLSRAHCNEIAVAYGQVDCVEGMREKERKTQWARVYRGCVCVARTTRAADVACTRACARSRRVASRRCN